LQRGFKLAGANTLLMSLWKVDDEATKVLMTEFYKNYLSGKTKRESLSLAQKTLRTTYPEPEYWAAFILLDALY
jgi:CHAT domain-containing protein